MIDNPAVSNINTVVLATMALIIAETIKEVAGNEISTRIKGQSLNAELIAELTMAEINSCV
jgi:fumarate reductase subunit C